MKVDAVLSGLVDGMSGIVLEEGWNEVFNAMVDVFKGVEIEVDAWKDVVPDS